MAVKDRKLVNRLKKYKRPQNQLLSLKMLKGNDSVRSKPNRRSSRKKWLGKRVKLKLKKRSLRRRKNNMNKLKKSKTESKAKTSTSLQK